MGSGMFDAVGVLMLVGYYAIVFGIPIGGAALITLIAALFVGSGLWMIVPIVLGVAGALLIDYKARHPY
jgi:hypothetical protein